MMIVGHSWSHMRLSGNSMKVEKRANIPTSTSGMKALRPAAAESPAPVKAAIMLSPSWRTGAPPPRLANRREARRSTHGEGPSRERQGPLP
jgi:hypothetical protein